MLIEMQVLEQVAPMIRSVAHPIRLRILDYLEQEGEPRTVTEIMRAAEASQAVVSQQLRVLRNQGILTARRQKNYIYYSLQNRNVLRILECIRMHRARQNAVTAEAIGANDPDIRATC
ncbi:MAG: metalloregulator ArsR/SmtB family transcription factor [Chloroherpetonaceae bacterium]|nr:metalloregulator ArsR/SmtB family transcription factor [Chthonomonadaceae bacterium]MDW8209026.1 metalloregulator ArsR/SmtB family transcription factor [Chloroherpetonaceae bacterium]